MKQLNTIQVSGHKEIPSTVSFFLMILFMCACLYVCVHVCMYMCMCVVAHGGQKRESDPPEAGVTGRCGPSHMGA